MNFPKVFFLKRVFVFLIAASALAPSWASGAEAGAVAQTGAGRAAHVMHFDGDWRVAGGLSEKVLLLSLQGLANRTEPRLYVVHPKDYQWEITEPLFNFYERRHGVRFTEVKSAAEALELFARHAKGFVIWDKDALVVSEETLPLVASRGMAKIDDLRGRYTGRSDAEIYQDAVGRYWARCSREAIMLMGGHAGAVRMPGMADWGVREKMFFHDLSANPAHAAELALEKRLSSAGTPTRRTQRSSTRRCSPATG
jgi:hypothetical protein